MSSVRDLLRARPEGSPLLLRIDPAAHPGVGGKRDARRELEATAQRLGALQVRLYAEHTRSLLLVLQGMDTSGKSGTVSHVFRGVNPTGLSVVAFKQPTEEERSHHFLWRVERHLPGPGQIAIFDRSHYEDVVVVRVRELVPEAGWRGRFDEITAWERSVAASGTAIVKVYLHISYDEQRERLLARIDDPDKHWKFQEGDIEARRAWTEYMAAYEDAIARCHTEEAPWYIVPADRKWYRNWAVERIVVETLEAMDPQLPRPPLDVAALRERLAPPN